MPREGQDDQEAEAGKVVNKLPLFRGSAKDTMSTLAWCAAVDRQKAQLGWSEERTALAAVDCFREGASDWFRVMEEERPNDVKMWAAFKPHVLERFGTHRTPAQKVAMLSALQQKGGESVVGFYDRCAMTYVLRGTGGGHDGVAGP